MVFVVNANLPKLFEYT